MEGRRGGRVVEWLTGAAVLTCFLVKLEGGNLPLRSTARKA